MHGLIKTLLGLFQSTPLGAFEFYVTVHRKMGCRIRIGWSMAFHTHDLPLHDCKLIAKLNGATIAFRGNNKPDPFVVQESIQFDTSSRVPDKIVLEPIKCF